MLEDIAIEHSAVDLSTCLSGACTDQSADYTTTATVHWQYSTNITLLRVNVTHTGGYAVWMDVGVSNALVSGCHITDLGLCTSPLFLVVALA